MPVANGESTPKPDPTTLTTQNLRREVEHLKELMDAKFAEINAIFDERRRGVDVAEREREKTQLVAEQEREKAARALRGELERRIDTAVAALRDHVTTQIEQIKLLATSLDDQSKLRIDGIVSDINRVEKSAEQHVEQLRREREMVTAAQQEAIAKADDANEKRFGAVDEFRAQLADQTASFMPREVAEQQFAEVRRSIAEITEKMSKVV